MKPLAQDFHTEVNLQTPLLEGLGEKLDRTDARFVQVNSRLGQGIAKMNLCKLWAIVWVELLLIVVAILL